MTRNFHILASCLLIAGLLCGLFVNQSKAANTVDCHCFRVRTFSAENPSAFDPYLLATVQNRLLAYSFKIQRKDIVSMKMSGTPGPHLWIVSWMSQAMDKERNEVDTLYNAYGSWSALVAGEAIDPEVLGPRFTAALNSGHTQDLAWAVVAQILELHFNASSERFLRLSSRGSSLKEALFAELLAVMHKLDAVVIFQKAQDSSWGSVMHELGTSIERLDKFLMQGLQERNS